MADRSAFVNYQERAREFQVGMTVVPVNGDFLSDVGKVTAVWPGIGMVDVELSSGNTRYPVEDLQVFNPDLGSYDGPNTNSTIAPNPILHRQANITNVVHGYVKQAIYWASADRKYRATQAEQDSGQYNCPKCRETVLKRAIYKRQDGRSERLLGCPICMFLIKASDLNGCHFHQPEEPCAPEVEAVA